MTERNPADPQALTVDDVQPDVRFVAYRNGQVVNRGYFTSTALDGWFTWRSVTKEGPDPTERRSALADFGIAQYQGGTYGPFWNDTYTLRDE